MYKFNDCYFDILKFNLIRDITISLKKFPNFSNHTSLDWELTSAQSLSKIASPSRVKT